MGANDVVVGVKLRVDSSELKQVTGDIEGLEGGTGGGRPDQGSAPPQPKAAHEEGRAPGVGQAVGAPPSPPTRDGAGAGRVRARARARERGQQPSATVEPPPQPPTVDSAPSSPSPPQGEIGPGPAPSPATSAPPPSPGGGGATDGGGGVTGGRFRAGRGAGHIASMASGAMGVALGGSILGFVTGAAQQFMGLSDTLTTLRQRFDDAEGSAGTFLGRLSGLRGEAAQIAEVMGAQTDQYGTRRARAAFGFSLWRGVDPAQTAEFMGRTERFTGQSPDMAAIYGQARLMGVGRGMLPEHLNALGAVREMMFRQTGTADTAGMLQVGALPSYLFAGGSADPRARGMEGVRTLGGLNQMLTGGSSAMRVTMMRAMGFGSKGGPGYLDMLERMEAGITDPQNLVDLFTRFKGLKPGGRSLSSDDVTTILSSEARRAGVPIASLRDISRNLMEGGGLERLRTAINEDDKEYLASFRASLSGEQAARFKEDGFEALGREGVSSGPGSTRAP